MRLGASGRRRIAALTMFACLGPVVLVRAQSRGIAVVSNSLAAADALRRSLAFDRVFASDLMGDKPGPLLSLKTSTPLARGRYRLHVPISLAPYTHPVCRDVSIKVGVADAASTFSLADLPESERPAARMLLFSVSGRKSVEVEVSWQVGEQGRKLRLEEVGRRTPKLSDAEALEPGGDRDPQDVLDLELEASSSDGSCTRSDAKRMPARLLALYPVIEALAPIGVTALGADKALYEPGEKGGLQVKVKNFGSGRAWGELTVLFRSGLGTSTEVSSRTISVGAAEETFEMAFAAPQRWGTEIAVVLSCDGKVETWRTYFGTTDNFWEMGIGHAYPIFTQGERGKSMVRGLPLTLRGKYSNWLDVFFWAPCDWSRLTPPSKLWWGGQTGYPHDEENLQALVKALQGNGIRVSAYVSRNAAGPCGWETARRHPEWFGGGRFTGRFNVEHLDHYNDPAWRARQEKLDLGWYGVRVDLTQLEPLDYGIDQIIESVKHYGWDAVRFDGHYTTGFDPVSTRNMRRLKERVLKAHPHFRFGYNWGRAPEWRGGFTHELREAMAGGGMYMQEGIRHWSYTRERYWTWSDYGRNEMRIAKRIQELGGTYHCILDLQGDLTPAQRYYKLVHSLICGAHPAYGTHHAVAGSPSWGAFMTRWAELIWHPHLRRVEQPDEQVQVGSRGVQWKQFVQECVLASDCKRLVVHLLNPPTHDGIPRGLLPPPLEQPVPVTFTPAAGETVKQIWLVRPDREPFGRPLDARTTGRKVSVVVPRLQHWEIVVAEIDGTFSVPKPVPAFTEPPDLARVPAGVGKAVSADPNQEADPPSIPPAEGFERLLDSGSANIGNPMVDDPGSPLGTVQGRQKGQAKVRMGKWWIGAPVGGYEVYLRVKWTDAKDVPTPQRLETQISATYKPPKWHKTVLVTPGYPDPPEGAVVLKEKGAYHDYQIATIDRWWDGCFCFVADARTAKIGDNQIFLERVIFKRVRTFSDAMLEERGARLREKPAHLRTPRGKAPEAIFVKAGMFWQTYLENAAFTYTLGYSLPKTYEELYRYDAIVLANCDSGGLQHRKMIRNYLADGGRLVLLGGNHALKYTAFANTFLSDLLPFELLKKDEVVRLKTPALLGPRKTSPAPGSPALFWRHVVRPHPGSTVLAWADEAPVSLRRSVEDGVVTAFIGTPLGSPSGDQTPFWDTDFWRTHLTTLVRE